MARKDHFLLCHMSKTFKDAWHYSDQNRESLQTTGQTWLVVHAPDKHREFRRNKKLPAWGSIFLFLLKDRYDNDAVLDTDQLHREVRMEFLKFMTSKDCPLLGKNKPKK